MATVYWEGVTTAWGTAGNWSGGSVPVDADEVIFDGRVAVSALTGMAQEAIDLKSLFVLPSYTGTIGAADSPLVIGISAGAPNLLWIRGSGAYYIQCGSDGAADEVITNTVIDTPGTVGLSSQLNASLGNATSFTNIHAVRGTVFIYGDADKAAHSGESGTAFGALVMAPTSNLSSNLTVTIGDKSTNWDTGIAPDITITEGRLSLFSQAVNLLVHGGVCTVGGTAYAMDDDDDDITTLIQTAGTIIWKPTTPVTTPTQASESPTIGAATIYGGTFDAASMLATNLTTDTDPTITAMTQYDGSIVKLANSYANIVVTTFTKYGGTTNTDPGQSITFT